MEIQGWGGILSIVNQGCENAALCLKTLFTLHRLHKQRNQPKSSHTETHRQTHIYRQAGRQAGRQTDRQAGTHTHAHTDTDTHTHTQAWLSVLSC
jgi:hypothetical protein